MRSLRELVITIVYHFLTFYIIWSQLGMTNRVISENNPKFECFYLVISSYWLAYWSAHSETP